MNRFFPVVLFILIYFNLSGQNTFQGTYPGSTLNSPSSFCKSPDGGYLICSSSEFFSNSYDSFLLKTDSLGNVIWSKTYGWTTDERPWKIRATNDGNYIFAGSTNWGPGINNIYIGKIDSVGNHLFRKWVGGSGIDQATDLGATTNGGFIIAGITNSFGAGESEYILINFDSNGDTLWTKTFGWAGQEECYAVSQTTDGGFIMAGYSTMNPGLIPHACLVKTDSIGNFSWMKSYSGTDFDNF